MRFLGVCFVGVLTVSSIVQASVRDQFGFGSSSTALGGISAVSANNASDISGDALAALLNPARMSLSRCGNPAKHGVASYGLLRAETQFTPISGVVVENETTSDKIASSDVSTQTPATWGSLLGLCIPVPSGFSDTFQAMSPALGVSLYMPNDRIATMDSGETYIPDYVMFRARTQRPEVGVGASLKFGSQFAAGAGMRLGYSLAGDGQVFLQIQAQKSSTLHFSADLKPKLAPYLGLAAHGERGALGLVVRMPLETPAILRFETGARALGGVAALDFKFLAQSVLYYDPWTIELGGRWRFFDSWTLSAQMDYQRWSAFNAPTFLISQQCPGNDCGVDLAATTWNAPPFRDLWVPRLGQSFQVSDRWIIRAGYSFWRGITEPSPTTDVNLLDPPRHQFSAGVGVQISDRLGLDAHFAYTHVVQQSITKTDSTLMGAPGYLAGGKILGGGISLGLEL